MQRWEADAAAIEAQFIPGELRAAGLQRCFIYRGHSMRPTFLSGQLLYVRPMARGITVGDVVVFTDPLEDGYMVHRVVAMTEAGWVTRGDNVPHNDALPVTLDNLVGRVEMLEDWGCLKPVLGGKHGLWLARTERWRRQVVRWLRRIVGAPYRALYSSPRVHSVILRFLARYLRVVRCKTCVGTFIKFVYKGKVIARWAPGKTFPQVVDPYDLFLHPEDLAHHAIAACGDSPVLD